MLIRQRHAEPSQALLANVSPLLARIYAGRQIQDPAELQLDAAGLHPPAQLQDIAKAAALLADIRQQQGRILIVADFDADGATSCALVIRALTQMGFQHIDYIVPDRFTCGYGLSPEVADMALARKPDLVITVDNGISSITGVAALKAAGVNVLITDHHLPGDTLPDADAIVNPNRFDCTFPSKNLAGVGVAFYLMLALRAQLRQAGAFADSKEPQLADLLDLVALGTVADLVPLDRNNRILVEQGLRRMRAGRCCAGIAAIVKRAGRNLGQLNTGDLGFAVAPRLNAAGRLEDMSLGISCLLSDDPINADRFAVELNAINEERKRIETDMREQAAIIMADRELQALAEAGNELPPILCLYRADWHQGVVGILASRLKEQFHRPVLVFANAAQTTPGGNVATAQHDAADVTASEGMELKGSGRSIPGLHLRDLLDRVASQHPGLIDRFGGHAMAAGLSLASDQLEAFTQAVTETAREMLDEEMLTRTVVTDGNIAAQDLQLATAETLREAGPWGQAFPEPLFDGEFTVLDQRIVGSNHLKLRVRPHGSQQSLDAIAFNVDTDIWPNPSCKTVRLVYRLDVNDFRQQRQLQLVVDHILP
ncbi:single-stranded-DNA-specific exonuclease RecJ [Pseudohongiella nitratireducens]|uniref:Single-stranded-DNA-specific exonuclease RecJ n=1 Tax=Pseudohongiella nitratireducens TaxID=1768907 RepID=A0A917GS67_9GAMM|nr:DHH family phosphoesterase [Pseudohongiella nitratireducens]MDF1621939.1 DHHA1 domain-containing protein [Pseudohongiella nitratireducens]GGG55862.1 single-stranded-DNA-specific exonuclease RecJ [Pseudohongiella nitratireducens]